MTWVPQAAGSASRATVPSLQLEGLCRAGTVDREGQEAPWTCQSKGHSDLENRPAWGTLQQTPVAKCSGAQGGSTDPLSTTDHQTEERRGPRGPSSGSHQQCMGRWARGGGRGRPRGDPVWNSESTAPGY